MPTLVPFSQGPVGARAPLLPGEARAQVPGAEGKDGRTLLGGSRGWGHVCLPPPRQASRPAIPSWPPGPRNQAAEGRVRGLLLLVGGDALLSPGDRWQLPPPQAGAQQPDRHWRAGDPDGHWRCPFLQIPSPAGRAPCWQRCALHLLRVPSPKHLSRPSPGASAWRPPRWGAPPPLLPACSLGPWASCAHRTEAGHLSGATQLLSARGCPSLPREAEPSLPPAHRAQNHLPPAQPQPRCGAAHGECREGPGTGGRRGTSGPPWRPQAMRRQLGRTNFNGVLRGAGRPSETVAPGERESEVPPPLWWPTAWSGRAGKPWVSAGPQPQPRRVRRAHIRQHPGPPAGRPAAPAVMSFLSRPAGDEGRPGLPEPSVQQGRALDSRPKRRHRSVLPPEPTGSRWPGSLARCLPPRRSPRQETQG